MFLDIAAAREPVIGSTAPDAIYLGRDYRSSQVGKKFRYGGDQHVVVIGPNGKGKSVSILFPNLLQIEDRSVVVVDVKGELAAVTAPFRSLIGLVKIINPYGLFADRPDYEFMRSSGFNPLTHLDPKTSSFNRKAARLAEAMISVEPDARDPHWPLSGRAMLAAIIMYVVIEAHDAGCLPSMRRVRALLCEASGMPSREHPTGFGLPKLAADMIEIGLRDAWAAKNYRGLVNKAGQFVNYSREVESIASTARIQTESFDDAEVAEDMDSDPFDFSSIKRDPTTVYIVVPVDELERQSKWIRLVLTAAFDGVMRPRQVGEPKTLFILDEFFALGKLDIVETVWSLIRGFGIQIMPILQHVGQMKTLYPQQWEGLLGMAGATVSFGANDPTTLSWLVNSAGDTSRLVDSFNRSHAVSDSTGGSGPHGSWNITKSDTDATTTTVTKAPVITAQTLRGLPPGYMVGVFDGIKDMQPIYAAPYMDLALSWSRAYKNPYVISEATREASLWVARAPELVSVRRQWW